jgi:hypothetical protein
MLCVRERVARKRCVNIETNLPPFLTPWRGLLWLTQLDIDLDVQSRLPEIRNPVSSGATATGTLDGSDDAQKLSGG